MRAHPREEALLPVIVPLVGSAPAFVFFAEALIRYALQGEVRPEQCLSLFIAGLALPASGAAILYGIKEAVRVRNGRVTVAVVVNTIFLAAVGYLVLLAAVSI